jgi:hypothetical protein
MKMTILQGLPLLASILMVMNPSIGQAPASAGVPKFGFFQCRADAQKWTYDPTANQLDPKFATGAAILVNGQVRVLPHLSYGVTFSGLTERIYESGVCTHEDSDFEKQFATYSTIQKSYQSEQTFRYANFITKHNLTEQFKKEDTEQFK